MFGSRRRFLKTAVAAGAVGALAGCMGGDDGGDAATDADLEDLPEVEMTIAHSFGTDLLEHWQRSSVTFKQYMESATDGRFQVEISPGAELGGNIEQIEQTQDGTIEATTSHSEGQLAPFYDNANVLTIPYAFENIEVAQHVLDGEFGQWLWNDFREQTGLRVLSHYDNGGFRSFTTGGPRITSVDDFDGLQMRVMPITGLEEMTRQLGADPVAIDGAELYESLDQGVADGQENSMVTIMGAGFYEPQEFLIRDGHTYSINVLLMNDAWFDDLHPTYQRLVTAAGKQAEIDARRVNRVQRTRAMDYLSDHLEIYEPDDALVDDFREATIDPVTEVVRDEVDDEHVVDDFFDAIETARDELGF